MQRASIIPQLTMILSLLSPFLMHAQESFSAAGGEGQGHAGSFSYTIGQTFFLYHASATGSVSLGVQQSYLVSFVSVKDPKGMGMDFNINVFPNPTTDDISVSVDRLMPLEDHRLTYILYDLSGRKIWSGSLIDKCTSIDLHSFESGTYFLKILSGKREYSTYKIIKIR